MDILYRFKETKMKVKFPFVISLLVLALFAAACGSRPAAAGPKDEPTASHAGPLQEMTSLVDALRAAGATVELGESVEQVFFSVSGDILKVNGADVQVFEYNSVEAMEADAVQISDDGSSIGTSMVTWMATPHFYKAGRILVLYVGDDQSILELLEGTLGPQFAGR
jgi:hypothetical protein